MNPKPLIQLSWQLPLLLLLALLGLPDLPLLHPQWGLWPAWLLLPAAVTALLSRTRPDTKAAPAAHVLVMPARRLQAGLAKANLRKAA
jgi:hypothetical protein